MNHLPHAPDKSEQDVLQHYRAHSQGEPSAAVDAYLLAAAAAAVKKPQTSPLARLHAWLFAGSQRARWSVAFASLAMLGLGLGLTLRTVEQTPQLYDMPASSAMQAPASAPEPMMIEQSAAPAPLEKKIAERYIAAPENSASGAAMADMQMAAPLAEEMEQAKAAAPQPSARLAGTLGKAEVLAEASASRKLNSELERVLLQVLELRRKGQEKTAAEQLKVLQQRYPQLDLPAELKRLQAAEAEKY